MSNCKPPCPPAPPACGPCTPVCPPPPVLPSANCPPCAPIPPIQIPACGDTSVWPAIAQLNQRVNECIGQTNSVIAKAQQTMACIQQAACENGAYYAPNEVNVEEGYDAVNSSKYFVYRIKPVAMDGSPIKVQLKLAYDNTTNSRLEQNAFEASEAEYAQILVPAVPVNENIGWFGLAVWNDAPIPSTALTNAYTAGFTKFGRLKWYANTTDMAQLKRDQIENALGVYGILVAGGEITDPNLRANIPFADQRLARICIGQNYDTRETFILACGNEDTNGMTSLACASILKNYGCDTAVECCQGDNVCALDKGQMLFTPDGHKVPGSYAYWYVTKKCSYRTQFVRELAELTQKYGQAIWAANLTYGSVSEIVSEIDNLNKQYAQLQTDVAALKAESGQSSQIVQNLQTQVTLMDGRLDIVEEKVAQILQDTGSISGQFQIINQEINNLKTSLSQEISDRMESYTNLQNKLNSEITARTNADTQIRGLINDLATTVTQNKDACDTATNDLQLKINTINNTLTTHSNNIASIQTDLQNLISKTQRDYDTLSGLINDNTTDIGNLKVQVASLLESMTKLDEAVSNYTIELADIEQTLSGIKEVNVTILAQQQDLLDKYNSLPSDLTEFSDRLTEVEKTQETVTTEFNEIKPQFEELQTKQTALEAGQQGLEENLQQNTAKIGQLESCCQSVNEDIQNLMGLTTENTNDIENIWGLLLMVPSRPVLENGLSIYFANNGNDQNDGLSVNTPIKTIERAIQIMNENYNQTGFILLFKSGETFTFPSIQIKSKFLYLYSWDFETQTPSQNKATINWTGSSLVSWHIPSIFIGNLNMTTESYINIFSNSEINNSNLTKFGLLHNAICIQSTFTDLKLNAFLLISSGDILSFHNSSLALIITTNLQLTGSHPNVHVVHTGELNTADGTE